MEKHLTAIRRLFETYKPQIIRLMEKSLTLFLIFFSITASSFSQKISIKMGEVKLHEALKAIKKEAKVDFFYSDKELDVTRTVYANFTNTETQEVVSQLVGANYNVQKNNNGIILISPKPKTPQQQTLVKGKVKDKTGMPIPGATVLVKGTVIGTSTDFDGNYTVRATGDAILVFSYVGYKTKEVEVQHKQTINVILEEDVSKLEEVIITGIVERKKESFTGAVTTVKGEELKTVGNLNVIESLKTLDPSFVIVENNALGSNPNRLPDIEVRGKTSIGTDDLRDEFGGNPNQPLFVLDGFETTLRTIIDLDMNRVASITILKDASSTALYGARAANGVVVVETIRPEAGKLRINYTGDFRFEMPDLTDYNLMNSAQKLEYERLSGLWTTNSETDYYNQFILDAQYNKVLAEIASGVDTYWLNEPVQVGATIGNSIYASGGTGDVTYGLGINYRNQEGVMKESGRKTWGTNFDLTYRKGKVNFSNRLRISGYDADESPYGSFSTFASANPYFRKTDENGNISKFLDIGGYFGSKYGNPLYDANLNSYNNTKNIQITNNTQAIWSITNKLRLTTNLQINKLSTVNKIFIDPAHSQFSGTTYTEAGTYNNIDTESFSYTLNSMATYATVFKDRHSITANLRGSISENNSQYIGVSAVGFPLGTNGNPIFSFGYKPNSKPNSAVNKYRRIDLVASANYDYNKTYFFDVNYRLDGSTVFGANNKYTPFWSVGAGWNLANQFNFDDAIVSSFRLRGSVGKTGNQGFGNLSDITIYNYQTYTNNFGQAVDMVTLANPDLKWQKTLDYSFGLEMSLLKNRITAQANIYRKLTDPLVVKIDKPSSTGIVAYPINAGLMDTNGFETMLRISPIYNLNDQIIWTITLNASSVTSKFDDFNNTLQSLNDEATNNTSLQRYYDGYSPDDLWAVPSLGIDPATGEEVYLTLNGNPTFEYNTENIRKVGNSRPTVEGVIGNTFRYKNFSASVSLRYRLGGDVLNNALYNKVENISRAQRIYNHDVRALTDRWVNPGDITLFKSITDFDDVGKSSRFIQEENILLGESINLGYELTNKNWMNTIGLSRLRLNAYMNDIFRVSSIKSERGIDYPFARNISFSINASF
ncbi:MAG: SusC/RagA family TonB-linked outer membrane protein [Aestuariibaculum sp.]